LYIFTPGPTLITMRIIIIFLLLSLPCLGQSKEQAPALLNDILRKLDGKTIQLEQMGVLAGIKVSKQEFAGEKFISNIQIDTDLPLYQTVVIPWAVKVGAQSQQNAGYSEVNYFFREEFTMTLANTPEEKPINVSGSSVQFYIEAADLERFEELIEIWSE